MSTSLDQCVLGVFLRAPERGRVKTRLAAELADDGALSLYEAFVEDTLRLCEACASGSGLALAWWLDGPPSATDAFGALALPGVRRRQSGGALGERLAHSLQAELAERGRALFIGSDSPSLPVAYVRQAGQALERARLVLGPAIDGGFYLLGARAELAPELPALLAGVRWSTEHALADTLAAARERGIEPSLLPPWFDVDDRLGLGLLRLQLALRPEAAPATARCLARLGGNGLLTWPAGS